MKKQLVGELAILASALFFSLGAVVIKVLTNQYDVYFASWFRFAVGIALSAIFIFITGRDFRIYDKKLVILRSFYGAAAMVLYYIAIQMTSSGRATLLNTTYPVFVVIFGALFYKTKVRADHVISIVLCLAGVILVFYDGSKYNIWGDVIGLVSAVFAAQAMHYMKKARVNNNSFIIYMSVCGVGLLGTSFSLGQFARLDWMGALLLVVSGAIMFLGQIALTYGIKFVSTIRGSVLSFSKIVFTIIMSLFIGEVIKTKFIIGTVLIIIGLVINREPAEIPTGKIKSKAL
jgi:drug/metabolite transporter (DMT)-like permease